MGYGMDQLTAKTFFLCHSEVERDIRGCFCHIVTVSSIFS